MERCPYCGQEHIPAGFWETKIIVRNGGTLTPERKCRLAKIASLAFEDEEHEILETFLQSTLNQMKINRIMHEGEETTAPKIPPEKWAMIVNVHAGHLTQAVMERDKGEASPS